MQALIAFTLPWYYVPEGGVDPSRIAQKPQKTRVFLAFTRQETKHSENENLLLGATIHQNKRKDRHEYQQQSSQVQSINKTERQWEDNLGDGDFVEIHSQDLQKIPGWSTLKFKVLLKQRQWEDNLSDTDCRDTFSRSC